MPNIELTWIATSTNQIDIASIQGTQNQIDGVIVATPPQLHFEMVLKALNSQIPVLVEKPFTLKSSEAQLLHEVWMEKKTVPLIINHIYLFHPSFIELKNKCKERDDIQSIECIAGNYGPFRNDVSALWDYGPHDIAMVLDLVKEYPIKISSSINQEKSELVLEFKNIKAKILISNKLQNRARKFTVHFTNHSLVFDDTEIHKLCLKHSNQITPIPISPNLPLNQVLDYFCKTIYQKEQNEISNPSLGVQVVKILESI